MTRYLAAMLALFALLGGWIALRTYARRFAARHPEFGPQREEGGGCCGACSGSVCRRRDEH